MDKFFSLQCLNNSLYKITTNLESKICSTDNIIEHLPKLEQILIIAPYSFNIQNFVNDLMQKTNIQMLKHIYPSAAASFTFEVTNIFYIYADYLAEEDLTSIQAATIDKEEHIKDKIINKDLIRCSLELIQKKKFNRLKVKVFEGNLSDVIQNIYYFLNTLEDKINLASNVYIDSGDKNLKKLLEEKLMMQVCDHINYNQIKRLKFLNVPNHIANANMFYESIKTDPISIGGLLGGKAIFTDGNDYMTRDDFCDSKYDKLMLHS